MKKVFYFVAISAVFLYCQSCNCQTGSVGNEHEWVDLGLSVKWATCNVGASKPEDYGNYYAWGETDDKRKEKRKEKRKYDAGNYKYYNDTEGSFTKYCVNSEFGTVDNKTCLEPLDDAASQNWYGMWRMPTKAEWDELISNCFFSWTWNYNGTGVMGFVVKSRKEGYTDKSIFLPLAGEFQGHNFIEGGGCYWSSSCSNYKPVECSLQPFRGGVTSETFAMRWDGLSVRPVIEFTE